MNWIMEMKKCKPGEYYCYTDKKCKKIPMGWHIARGGYIEKDNETETKKNGNGNGNSNGNGNGGNGSGGNGNGGNGGGGISEAAVSRAQQRFFGMVRSAQKGEMGQASSQVQRAASSMKKGDVKDFASTKHKGLPEKKVKKESFAIDPKSHRQQQRSAKIRNLAKKGATEGERSAAEKKTKGPKMFGETAYYKQDASYQKKLSDEDKANKEKDARIKHGKNWKKFTSDVDSAKNRLRKGEVKKFNKQTGKWESNKD